MNRILVLICLSVAVQAHGAPTAGQFWFPFDPNKGKWSGAGDKDNINSWTSCNVRDPVTQWEWSTALFFTQFEPDIKNTYHVAEDWNAQDPDITKVLFKPGYTYAIWPYVAPAGLSILVPRDNVYVRMDRARADMLHAVKHDSRFQTYNSAFTNDDINSFPGWEYRCMMFETSASSTLRKVCQVTSTTNGISRQTIYEDAATGQWTQWTTVDWNKI